MAKSDEQVVEEFDEAVNMSPKELEEWLEIEESKEVGQKDGASESKGHESGRKIVEILGKDRSDYTDENIDYNIRRVVSYVHRHQAQKSKSDVETPSGATPYELRTRPLEVASRVHMLRPVASSLPIVGG
jgi:hypothetical protein